MCSREITEGGFWGERHDDSAPEELASIKLDSPVAKLTATICFDEATAGESFTKCTDGDDTARFSCIPEGKLAPIKLGPVKKLSFKLDHFTGARFGLFMYSTKETGGSAYFSDFIYET